jgi:hypothetical protein
MATTTNFGWTTPDDTSLVKDGAAAIRSLGQAIDTSMMDLEGGTTGQSLTKNSNTDMDFVWTTIASGGMTSIASGSLSGSEVSITSIPGTYVNLFLVIDGYSTGGGALALRYNTISTSTYSNAGVRYTNSDAAAFWNERATTIWYLSDGNPDAASTTNGASVLFPMYAGSSVKQVATLSNYTSGGVTRSYSGFGVESGTGAITSIQIRTTTGTFDAGTYNLYGVK